MNSTVVERRSRATCLHMGQGIEPTWSRISWPEPSACTSPGGAGSSWGWGAGGGAHPDLCSPMMGLASGGGGGGSATCCAGAARCACFGWS